MAPATTGLEDYFQYCDILVVNESEVCIIMNLMNNLTSPKRMRLKGEINCDILVIYECEVYMHCHEFNQHPFPPKR